MELCFFKKTSVSRGPPCIRPSSGGLYTTFTLHPITTDIVIVTYIQRHWTSYDGILNIGCKVNVVYEPPEDDLIQDRNICRG